MDKSERVVQAANADLNSAAMALQLSYNLLSDIESPQSGNVSKMLASRELLSTQREVIQNNRDWVDFAKNQVELAKKQLKLDMIEHEKFKYLELEEIKKILKAKKLQEAKELDEVALMTYGQKENK
ncbi:MAG: flagellar FliJ family protein [Sulfurimonas sp.]|nr:flagellar FliJ family protein [Sulfurimonas sp.]